MPTPKESGIILSVPKSIWGTLIRVMEETGTSPFSWDASCTLGHSWLLWMGDNGALMGDVAEGE